MTNRISPTILTLAAMVVASPHAWAQMVEPQSAVSPSAAPRVPTLDGERAGFDSGCWRDWRDEAPVSKTSRYEAVFDGGGLEITPVLGTLAPRNLPLRMTLDSIWRGEMLVADASAERSPSPTAVDDVRVEYSRGGGIVERYDASEAGVELSFVFPRRPVGSGDLIVRSRIETELIVDLDGAGGDFLRFEARPEGAYLGAVTIGAVTGIDARGNRVEGHLRYDGTWLELVLPGHFIDRAEYPLLLDPLIGTDFPVDVYSRDSRDPDVAYDVASNLYCIVWTWSASSTDTRILARQVHAETGAWMNPNTLSAAGSISRHPTVANVRQTGCFVIAWERLNGPTAEHIEARQLFAAATAPASTTLVVTTDGREPDIAGDPSGTDDEAVVVWSRSQGIYAADLRTNSTIRTWTTMEVAQINGAREPAISKSFDTSTGRGNPAYLVVWVESNQLWARAIHRDMVPLIPRSAIVTSGSRRHPDVAGDGQNFLVVSEHSGWIDCTGVRVDQVAGRTSNTSRPGFGSYRSASPSVAYAGDRYVLACRGTNITSPGYLDYDLNVGTRLFPSGDVDPCGPTDVVAMPAGSGVVDLALVSHRSATWADDDRAFIVFERSDGSTSNLRGQRFEVMGPGGPTVDLGGGCGLGGALAADGPFAIGNSNFGLNLTGSDPGATLAVLNLGLSGTPITCGPCRFVAPLDSLPLAIAGGQASLSFPIGCSQALIGATIESQALLLSASSQACPLVVGIAASNRLQMTVGR